MPAWSSKNTEGEHPPDVPPFPAEEITALQQMLSHIFRDPQLLLEAVTHTSYVHEAKASSYKDNERLEFLGDAVLGLIMSEYWVAHFPTATEGDLSKMKAHVVNEQSLARVARRLMLGQHLLLGRGEEMTGGREKSSLLANALEAVIAALYVDGGLETAQAFVLRSFKEELKDLMGPEVSVDYKTEFQEFCQKEHAALPTYTVLRESGPDHEKIFEVELAIRGKVYGRGQGRSKKEAERRAAKEALEKILHQEA